MLLEIELDRVREFLPKLELKARGRIFIRRLFDEILIEFVWIELFANMQMGKTLLIF
jgi:hypothetical protein